MNIAWHLLDHQIDVGTAALVAHDLDVFQAHQGLEDLSRGLRYRTGARLRCHWHATRVPLAELLHLD